MDLDTAFSKQLIFFCFNQFHNFISKLVVSKYSMRNDFEPPLIKYEPLTLYTFYLHFRALIFYFSSHI